MDVIATRETRDRLCKLLKTLERKPTEMAPGVKVVENERVPGKYSIAKHNGKDFLQFPSPTVRVYNRYLLVTSARTIVESLLRDKKIPFREYEDIDIKHPNARTLDLRLPSEPNIEYRPTKRKIARAIKIKRQGA